MWLRNSSYEQLHFSEKPHGLFCVEKRVYVVSRNIEWLESEGSGKFFISMAHGIRKKGMLKNGTDKIREI